MATAPRPGVSARAEAAALTITIEVDGTPHTLRPGELSALDVSAVRRATRELWGEPVSVQRLLSSVLAGEDDSLEPDIDAVAVIVWLARRQTGEQCSLSDVMGSITFDTELGLGEEDDDADPLGSSEGPSAPPSPDSPTTSDSGGNTSP